jgi:flagellar export protein FliJ
MADKDIHSLIRLKKWTVDEERRALSDILAQETAVIRRQLSLEETVRREQAVAAADTTGLAGRAYGAFARAAVELRERLEKQRDEIAKAVAAQRDKVAVAFQEFKTLEQIQKNRDARARVERDRKEQAAMDEIAANNHRRRHAADH